MEQCSHKEWFECVMSMVWLMNMLFGGCLSACVLACVFELFCEMCFFSCSLLHRVVPFAL
jgi:hypothetical protein